MTAFKSRDRVQLVRVDKRMNRHLQARVGDLGTIERIHSDGYCLVVFDTSDIAYGRWNICPERLRLIDDAKDCTQSESAQFKRAAIFRPDGTLRGVTYQPSAKRKRGSVLNINIQERSNDKGKLATSFAVDGFDFFEVYAKVVDRLIDYYDVSGDPELVAEMRASAPAFLESKGLCTKRVEHVYEQLVSVQAD